MDYIKYRKSRNASWQILIDNHVHTLPVCVSRICKNMDIPLVKYSDARDVIKSLRYEEYILSNDGFTYKGTVFYNELCTIQRRRFTAMHEVGHIVRGHQKSLCNREPSQNDNPLEQEANVFASRILAPACVLWGIGVTSAEQIAELCNISIQSAQFRMQRMELLYAREREFLHATGKSCFLRSPLERRVYAQFEDYINTHKL